MEFTLEDIEDVRILIKAKGGHFAIVPKGDREEARQLRIAMAGVILQAHYIIDKPLEELKPENNG